MVDGRIVQKSPRSSVRSSTSLEPSVFSLKAGLPRCGQDAQRKASPLPQLPQADASAGGGGRTPSPSASSCSFRPHVQFSQGFRGAHFAAASSTAPASSRRAASRSLRARSRPTTRPCARPRGVRAPRSRWPRRRRRPGNSGRTSPDPRRGAPARGRTWRPWFWEGARRLRLRWASCGVRRRGGASSRASGNFGERPAILTVLGARWMALQNAEQLQRLIH